MPFPVEYRGEVRHRTTTRLRGAHLHHAVVHELATALRATKGTVTVEGATVSFTTGQERIIRNTNILLLIAHGSLAVSLLDDTMVVAYTLNVQPLVALASVLALGALATSAEPLTVRVGVPAVVWVIIFGVQYLTTIVRFRAFARPGLTMTNQHAAPADCYVLFLPDTCSPMQPEPITHAVQRAEVRSGAWSGCRYTTAPQRWRRASDLAQGP